MIKMKKKLAIIPIGAILVIAGVFLMPNNDEIESEIPEEEVSEIESLHVDVFMPNKSSRPGCEETDSCYIPPTFVIKAGQSVTWQNQDVAFHSVTSGSYENPTEDFDSGHLDPDEVFTLTFDEPGEVDYFCTLHPWMKGKVIVEN